MENKEKTTLELEENNDKQNVKKNLKWLWITLAIIVVLAIGAWCTVWALKAKGLESAFKFSNAFVLFVTSFIIIVLGYLLGRISIKGVTLGTAGVFLIAILFGYLCTLNFQNVKLLNKFHYMSSTMVYSIDKLGGPIQNIGLILFLINISLIVVKIVMNLADTLW